jgi:hypothetical protein
MNFIPAIQYSNGLLTASLKAVGEEFVNYYQQLLRSLKDMILIDLEVIQNGSCLATSAHELLLALVTITKIKKKRCCLVLATIKPLVLMVNLLSFSRNPGMLLRQFFCSCSGFLYPGAAFETNQPLCYCSSSQVCQYHLSFGFQTHFLL